MHHKRFNNRGIVPVSKILFGVAVLLIVSLLLAVANSQAISDYFKLRGYTPSPDIARLADQTAMTDDARRLFYVNHPQLADRSSFNGTCNNRGEHTIVLGCYRSVDRGIFLFDVTDERLEGVEQVTAAHEMLHAAYDRLSNRERDDIDEQLQNFYEHQVTDKRLRNTIAAYEESEPNDIPNEMHSIFATEIGTLTPELERYYRRYFTNRQKVVEFADNYQSEFSSRQQQVQDYDDRLAELKGQIDTNTEELKRQEAGIEDMQAQMNEYRRRGDTDAYNALVPEFNQRVDTYNALVRRTQTSISTYNALVVQRNQVALEIRGLTQSISSQISQIE